VGHHPALGQGSRTLLTEEDEELRLRARPIRATSFTWITTGNVKYGHGHGSANGTSDERGGDQLSDQITLVDYLELGDDPHLVANECCACGAKFFDRRNACASCGKTEFQRVRVAGDGEVRAFTIVSYAAPGVPVPFVAALVDCDGTSVRANLINVEADPDHVSLGMKVRLATYSLGEDSNGTEAIGFGFEPQEAHDNGK